MLSTFADPAFADKAPVFSSSRSFAASAHKPWWLVTASAWLLLVLGVAHIGLALYQGWDEFAAAMRDGFIGQFRTESRRAAIWFTLFGGMLAIVGHRAVQGVAEGDGERVRSIGRYLAVVALPAAFALPASPFFLVLAAAVVLAVWG